MDRPIAIKPRKPNLFFGMVKPNQDIRTVAFQDTSIVV